MGYMLAIALTISCEWSVFVLAVLFIKYKRGGDFFEGKTFDAVSLSCHPRVPLWALAIVRLVLFGWFFGFAVVYLFTLYSSGWHWYTEWNIFMLSIYYLLAFVASSIKIYKTYYQIECTSEHEKRLALVIGSVYPVAASAALMITTLNFTLLSPAPTMWNITQHATTSISFMLLEMPLNSIPVNWQDVVWAAVWPMSYLIFIWTMVSLGIRKWPYYFLEAYDASCFFWYNVLFIAAIAFFYIIFWIVRAKEKRLRVDDRDASPQRVADSAVSTDEKVSMSALGMVEVV